VLGALTELVHLLCKLRVDVLPLAHADERQEVLAAELAELARAELVLLPLQEIPQSKEREEIAGLIAILTVRLVGRVLLVDRTVARVLDAERGRDDLRGRFANGSIPGFHRRNVALPFESGHFPSDVIR